MTKSLPTLAAFLAVLATCGSAVAANRYDPRLRFRAIETPRFTIYFHQGEEGMARRLAAIAEEVASRVATELGAANGRVHVILVDQNDLSNGWAVPAPYNLIEITAAAPPGDSTIGNTDDWLRLVFSHEYTHIVHLDKAHGWIGRLRNVFGHAPVLYPNLFLPLWQIEGIATYNESRLTGEGRVPAADFRLVLDRAAAEGRFDPIDRANGGLVDWPAGSAHYVYGAYFHQYLADRFGPESIVRLSDETAGQLPYFGARSFRKVFHRSLGDLWEDFAAATRAQGREQRTGRTQLTRDGFSVGAPAFSRSGRLFYSIANPHGFPALMELPGDGAPPRQIATRYLGSRIASAGTLLVFDQTERVRNVALQWDLYAVDENGGHVRRLTEFARAADPDVAPDGRTIVCTVQSADRRGLATLQLPTNGATAVPVALVSEPSTEYSSPRWSPNGQAIAAERRRLGGPSEIVVVDVATRLVHTVVSSHTARNVTPFWLSEHTLLFASDRDGRPFQIYSVDMATGSQKRLDGAGDSAQAPVVSPDGRSLVYVGYTPSGYDLFLLPFSTVSWSDVPPIEPGRPDRTLTGATDTKDHAFRPWSTLAPRFWMPFAGSDAGELEAGATTYGADALGRHAYAGAIGWTTARARPDWSIAYAYDRWWPTLFVNLSDDTDPWRGGEIRTSEVNIGALFTSARVRRSQTLLTALHASTDAFDCAECATPLRTSTRRNALRVGWTFDNTKTYGYSISREAGAVVRVTWETAPEALGSEASADGATLDVRAYHHAGPRHAAIALRGAAAASWGDADARRIFSASGSGPAAGDFDFGRNAIGLLRGFAADAIVGDRVVIGNLDYRFPLRQLQRGVGTLPIFFRSVHGAVFADAANAWGARFQWGNVRMSAGAEISMDAVAGYALPLTFATGIAWRNDPVLAQRGVAVFGRIGRGF